MSIKSVVASVVGKIQAKIAEAKAAVSKPAEAGGGSGGPKLEAPKIKEQENKPGPDLGGSFKLDIGPGTLVKPDKSPPLKAIIRASM